MTPRVASKVRSRLAGGLPGPTLWATRSGLRVWCLGREAPEAGQLTLPCSSLLRFRLSRSLSLLGSLSLPGSVGLSLPHRRR